MNDTAETQLLAIDPGLDDLELPSPQVVNYVTLVRLGTLVQLTVGFVDIRAIVRRIAAHRRGEAAEAARSVPTEISSRIVMDPQTFHELKRRVDIIHAAMEQSGHLKDVIEHPNENEGTKEADKKEGEAS